MIHLITSFYIEKKKGSKGEKKNDDWKVGLSDKEVKIMEENKRMKEEIRFMKESISAKKKVNEPSVMERNAELQRCLMYNLKSEHIKTVHIFADDQEAADLAEEIAADLNKDLKIINIGKQPKYSDLFNYANSIGQELCMICNSDIYLYQINMNEMKYRMSKNDVFCLTRHEWNFAPTLINHIEKLKQMGGAELQKYMNRRGFKQEELVLAHNSVDAFLFWGPLDRLKVDDVEHKQNVLGSENIVVYELNSAGYDLKNPCKDIIIIHEHRSNKRSYNKNYSMLFDAEGGKHKYWRESIGQYVILPDHLQ